MSKHSKNNCSKAVFTNYERARVKSGTEKLRLGHDSLKPFDACSISLEPLVNPVADLQGHLYSKNAIYDHVLEQKRIYELQMKAYHKQQEELKRQEELSKQALLEKKVAEFDERESSISTKAVLNSKPKTLLSTETLNSYWLPELAPEAKQDILKKPSSVIKSPFGLPIKLKELVPLNLTPLPGFDDGGNRKTGRYICPLCKKSLNSVKGVCCLKVCGHVFCTGCYNTILKKDMSCPLSNITFEESDLLTLESEGSSFASRSGEKLIATTKTPVARFG